MKRTQTQIDIEDTDDNSSVAAESDSDYIPDSDSECDSCDSECGSHGDSNLDSDSMFNNRDDIRSDARSDTHSDTRSETELIEQLQERVIQLERQLANQRQSSNSSNSSNSLNSSNSSNSFLLNDNDMYFVDELIGNCTMVYEVSAKKKCNVISFKAIMRMNRMKAYRHMSTRAIANNVRIQLATMIQKVFHFVPKNSASTYTISCKDLNVTIDMFKERLLRYDNPKYKMALQWIRFVLETPDVPHFSPKRNQIHPFTIALDGNI